MAPASQNPERNCAKTNYPKKNNVTENPVDNQELYLFYA